LSLGLGAVAESLPSSGILVAQQYTLRAKHGPVVIGNDMTAQRGDY